VGSIAGVFVSGYILIDYLTVSMIFRATGVLTLFMAGLSLIMEASLKPGPAKPENNQAT
jgi:hypothetical protein